MTQKSILIISNEAAVRDMLTNLFADAGLRVSLAESGEEAFKILSNSSADFVLCDLFLGQDAAVAQVLGHEQASVRHGQAERQDHQTPAAAPSRRRSATPTSPSRSRMTAWTQPR